MTARPSRRDEEDSRNSRGDEDGSSFEDLESQNKRRYEVIIADNDQVEMTIEDGRSQAYLELVDELITKAVILGIIILVILSVRHISMLLRLIGI
jgi:hypothetical protein